MAVATPAMLPTPTVEARAVATAWNGETLPGSLDFGWRSLPSTSRRANGRYRNWTAPVSTVSSAPVPSRRTIIGQPQTYPFNQLLAEAIASVIASSSSVFARNRDLA